MGAAPPHFVLHASWKLELPTWKPIKSRNYLESRGEFSRRVMRCVKWDG
jgi:hypothetical protein